MVNYTLFLSTNLIIVPQALWECWVLYEHPHCSMAIASAISSWFNHGFTNRNNWTTIFMYIDRICIGMCTVVNVYVAPWPNALLAIFGGSMYTLAKCDTLTHNILSGNMWHIILHFIGSMSNLFVC